MANPLDPVSQGQRFRPSAQQTNAFIEAARFAKAHSGRQGGDSHSFDELWPFEVTVKNTTSSMIDAGGVVGLANLILKPDDTKLLTSLAFEVAAPTQAQADARQIAVLAEPLNKDGASARAYVAGVFPALVNFSSDGGAFAKVDPGNSDSLVADVGEGEYQIIWAPSGVTGEQWAIVTPMAVKPDTIVVFVTKDGGSDGTKTAAATWTYTAKTSTGVVLDTGLTPARARPRGTLTPASNGSRGLATYDTTGNLILLDAYGEFPGTGGCVPS